MQPLLIQRLGEASCCDRELVACRDDGHDGAVPLRPETRSDHVPVQAEVGGQQRIVALRRGRRWGGRCRTTIGVVIAAEVVAEMGHTRSLSISPWLSRHVVLKLPVYRARSGPVVGDLTMKLWARSARGSNLVADRMANFRRIVAVGSWVGQRKIARRRRGRTSDGRDAGSASP